MLVLSRKVGEEILIAGSIKVTVCRIDGNQVRLGFEAPQSVHIVRSELKPLGDKPRGLPLPTKTSDVPAAASRNGSALAAAAEAAMARRAECSKSDVTNPMAGIRGAATEACRLSPRQVPR